ncbi:LicD family protein [Dubosiella newyorkensis]|uniref:LicD family protein n=1 Tax=Dubosiella newyorkensis TaxID=1862672 RepID=UPI00248C1CE6|nr:LicD family protein [Dubosiella newyorkensis]
MIEIDLQQQKQIMIDILIKIDEFCNKNNINYFLADGTMIGAARHKGFIPWDDDIDIIMPRPDYELFIKKFPGSYENLSLATPYDEFPLYYYVKVYDRRTLKIEEIDYGIHKPFGIDIDVFPIDGESDRYDRFIKDFYKRKKILDTYCRIIAYRDNRECSFKQKIKNIVVETWKKMFAPDIKDLIKKYNRLATKYDYNSSAYVGELSVYGGKTSRHKKEIFNDYALVEFEGYKFRAPIDYKTYLTDKYGDYMKLPPENERITHHNYKAYWKDSNL